MNKLLVQKFEDELLYNIEEAKRKHKYVPTYLIQMIQQFGGVDAAKRLIQKEMSSNSPSEGFVRLAYWCNDEILTVEFTMSKSEYQSLFAEDEIAYCKNLLKCK